MADNNDLIKAQMIQAINNGGAWFSTRENNFLRIGAAGTMLAKECILEDGRVTGNAYTFGTDWFDISMHGRWTDIYVDPDTLKVWEIDEDTDYSKFPADLALFCREADEEALAGITGAYHIDGTGFAQNLKPSEERMGKKEDILSKVDLSVLEKE
ncbi:MAG: hypothetical protein IKE85_01165 [Mogibacterium sp.]|nr:hypothetical protein [Mogibacterium sp.]MBR2539426.1 hypothetical protein [Mogibacterium sp.]